MSEHPPPTRNTRPSFATECRMCGHYRGVTVLLVGLTHGLRTFATSPCGGQRMIRINSSRVNEVSMKTFGLAFLLSISAVHAASAGVCATLDESRDTLAPEDRRAASISFSQALAKAGVQLVAEWCE